MLVIRETPSGAIELSNTLKVTKVGGIIVPGSPGFYSKAQIGRRYGKFRCRKNSRYDWISNTRYIIDERDKRAVKHKGELLKQRTEPQELIVIATFI
ncbi:hypothetical protein GCM10007116_01430 [Sulfodiicoccus acidiphilus]|uniref:Uncharacterized protein n=1 Tax=Sulfodiicoccus acidiphilus TaxID=1670455 RepID=A0A830GYH6_9CREN|nr:hypothetical protein GCM10007116_01430 [Sulfodiicoccus acidiphilus]